MKTNFKSFLESFDSNLGKKVFLLPLNGIMDVNRPSLVVGKRIGRNHNFYIEGDIIPAKISSVNGNEVKLQFSPPVEVKWEYDGEDMCTACYIDDDGGIFSSRLGGTSTITILSPGDKDAAQKIVKQLLLNYKHGVPHARIREIINQARAIGFDHEDYKAIEKSISGNQE